ncbi:MAG: beta-galactosidase [Planctomycetota bacterium]
MRYAIFVLLICVGAAAAQEDVIIENKFLRATLSARAGRVSSLKDLATGDEIVATNQGLCVDREWRTRLPEMERNDYTLRRIEGGVEASYAVKDPKLSGLEYTKTYRLPDGSPALHVTLRIRNSGKIKRTISPWVFSRPMAGGAADDNDAFFIPAAGGLGVIRLADVSKETPDNFIENPRDGWIAVVDSKTQRGLIAFCEKEKLARFYVWNGQKPGTMEWIYREVELGLGKEWQTSYTIAPIRGVSDVAGASPTVVASLRRVEDEAAQKILLRLVSLLSLGNAHVRARIGGIDLAGMDGNLSGGKGVELNWPAGRAEEGTLEVQVEGDQVKEQIAVPLGADGAPRRARIGRASLAGRGGPERFHIASEPLDTQHVKWAKPLPGGPVKALCLAPIPTERDIDELAQRLDMEFDLVGFQYPLMDTAAAEEFIELLDAKTYDVIILGKVPMGLLPSEAQDLLMDRVTKGAGMLSVNTDATLATGAAINLAGDGSFLETALPMHLLPDGCRPEVKVGECGKGRCMAISYPRGATCLTPMVGIEEVVFCDWECYFQLLSRAVLWTARRETGVSLLSAWPAAQMEDRMTDPWRMERAVRVARPSLERETGNWKIATEEQTHPVDTWRGYGAKVERTDGRLKISETNLNDSRGFGAGAFPLDLDQTPILEATVSSAKEWSLFVPDEHLEKTVVVLQPATAETGVKQYDLRKHEALRGMKRAMLCFETIGEGSALTLDSIRFLTATGDVAPVRMVKPDVEGAGEIMLRLVSGADSEAVVQAIYHGSDYYDSMEKREQRVSLKKGEEASVEFPIANLCGGRPHAVDLIVRDAEGRSLAFATATYDTVSPVSFAAAQAEKEHDRRSDDTVVTASIENKGKEREVDVAVRVEDANGNVIGNHVQKVKVPVGKSAQRIALLTTDSEMMPVRAVLSIPDGADLALEKDAFLLTALDAEKLFYRRGEEAVIFAKIENEADAREVEVHIALTDMHGRLIAALDQKTTIPPGASERRFALPTDNSLTVLNRARVSVRDAKGLLLEKDAYIYLPEAQPAWDDYLASTSQFSVDNAYVRPQFMRIARDIGIEGMVIPRGYTFETLEAAAPVMYWGAAKVRAFGFNFRGEIKSNVRQPCLSDPGVRKSISDSYEETGAWLRRAGPMALASLEDESELTGARYVPHDVCTSEHCVKRFRQWLKEKYNTINRLNEEWSAEFKSFDEVSPMLYPEARKRDNPAPWVEWRMFMEEVWLDGLMLTRKGVKSKYHELRMGFSNTFGQIPFAGWNYETVSRHEDMTIEYPTVIHRIIPPTGADAFEEDTVDISTVIRQKMDIRKSFLRADCPAPGWMWYDRSEQGAEFKPWWMAFMGCKGCTPWGPMSLGVLPGGKSMSFWAFIHPRLAHTKSSTWLKSGLGDLTRGVGKIFVDYEKVYAPVAVLYSQPSSHLSWAWSDMDKTFSPDATSLYAWYFKSRVNVTRMLRELGCTPRWIGAGQIEAGELSNYKVLFLPCSLCLSDKTLEAVTKFVENGGLVVADIGTGAAAESGRPIDSRKGVEDIFGVVRNSVCRKVEPSPLTVGESEALPRIPKDLKLAGRDEIAPHADTIAAHADGEPAIVIHKVGKGRAIYLNGFLGYNMPSRELIRNIINQAGVTTSVRISSEGAEHMGYECAEFRRGGITVLGILRLREEAEATVINVSRKAHLYDVRNKKYLGIADVAQVDLTHKAAAVLALMPYEIKGVEVEVSPAQVKQGERFEVKAKVLVGEGTPGDHVLRVEVFSPSGALSRAYTDNVLAVGEFSRAIRTAMNEQPGRWRVVVTEVISGKASETQFAVSE